MLSVERLEVRIGLWELLQRTILIHSIDLDGANIGGVGFNVEITPPPESAGVTHELPEVLTVRYTVHSNMMYRVHIATFNKSSSEYFSRYAMQMS